jgi:hypothetical protein
MEKGFASFLVVFIEATFKLDQRTLLDQKPDTVMGILVIFEFV